MARDSDIGDRYLSVTQDAETSEPESRTEGVPVNLRERGDSWLLCVGVAGHHVFCVKDLWTQPSLTRQGVFPVDMSALSQHQNPGCKRLKMN